MKILYVTQHFWNRQYGAGMRNYGILRHLSQHHDLHIAVATSDIALARAVGVHELNQFGCVHILHRDDEDSESSAHSVLHRRLSPWKQDLRSSFLTLLDELNPDIVWYFEKYVIRRTGLADGTPVVVDFVDVQWRKLLRAARYRSGLGKLPALFKAAFSRIEDNVVARRATVVVLANAQEVTLLRTRRPVVVVANGFDFPNTMSRQLRDSRRLLFMGSLFYHPNLDGLKWFCDYIWPHVLGAIPDARLDVVGYVEKSIGDLPQKLGVFYHSYVEHVDQFVSQSSCLVVPLRIAGGTRIKILEAWANGLPVVSTTVGAEGLDAQHGVTLLIGDTAETFTNACVLLLQSPDLGNRLAASAFKHGKARFDWQAIHPALDRALSIARNA